MPLDKISICNFRGLREACLEFNQTTLLIGENNSGKSTLLDAVDLCLGVYSPENGFDVELNDFYRDGAAAGSTGLSMPSVCVDPAPNGRQWQSAVARKAIHRR